MARRRNRTRKSSRIIGPTGLLFVLLAASAVVGASVVPTSSFSLVEADRGSSVDVVDDPNGAVGLNVAPAVDLVGQSRLVTVQNNLGVDDVDITIELLSHGGSQLSAGSASGSPLTFTLDAGQQQQVDIDATGPPGPLTFKVTAQGAGVTAELERTTQVIRQPVDLTIDIRPGNSQNQINPQSQQTVPVGILNTTQFDPVNELDRSTIRFGAAGVPSPGGTGAAPQNIIEQDVDNDGDTDLFVLFKITNAGFQAGDTQGEVVAETTDGTFASGTDSVTIVGPPGGGGGPGGPGQAFEDVNQNGQFDQGTDSLIPSSEFDDGEYDAGDNGLVIPSGVGSLSAREWELEGEGVTVGVDLTATGGEVKIDGGDGEVDVSGVSVSATTKIELEAEDGVDLADADLSANRELKIESDGAVTGSNAALDANEKIEIKGEDGVDLTGAVVTANREVKLEADDTVTLTNAEVEAAEKIEVKGKSNVAASGATLTAGREIKLEADGTVTLSNAVVDANQKVEVKAKSSIDAANADIDAGREAKLEADGSVSLSGASVDANQKIEIKAEGSVSTSGASLTAGREVKIEAEGSVSLSGASVDANQKIEIKAEGSIDLANATLDAGREIKIEAGGSVSAMNATMTAGQKIEIDADGPVALNGASLNAPRVET